LLAGQGDQESSVLAVGQKKGPIIVPASLILVRRSLIAICTLAATRSRGESATTPPEFWMDDGVWRPQQQPAPQTPEPAPQTGYGRTVKLGRSLGGFLNEHWVRFQNLAAEGVHVEITSDCMSACTLVMTHMPVQLLCFGPGARLGFHKAQERNGSPSISATKMMVASYPLDLREWIESKGGIAAMPEGNQFWILTAPQLWRMGYSKCPRAE